MWEAAASKNYPKILDEVSAAYLPPGVAATGEALSKLLVNKHLFRFFTSNNTDKLKLNSLYQSPK